MFKWLKRLFYTNALSRRAVQPAVGQVCDKSALRELQEIIGYRFQNVRWLQQALQHRSYLHDEGAEGAESNERMEFLGDAVLELIVNDYLFHRFPNKSEGELTKIKGLVVSKPILAKKAKEIQLDKFLLMGTSSGGDISQSVIADAYEALVCAIYLDGNIQAANTFLHNHFLAKIPKIVKDKQHANNKSILQEYTQAKYKTHPQYRICKVEGPDHQQIFTMEVLIENIVVGVGEGRSKKEAQQEAARDALTKLGLWKNDD